MSDRKRLEQRKGHMAALEWGECQRRITLGGKVFADGHQIVDGWPSRSPSAQWRDGDSGNHKTVSQVFPEVFTQGALVVRQAMEHMSPVAKGVMWLVYVEGYGSPKRVREMANMSRDRFYASLGCAIDQVEWMMAVDTHVSG